MSQSKSTPVAMAASQVEQGAALFARVFQHDPMMKYLVADTARILG